MATKEMLLVGEIKALLSHIVSELLQYGAYTQEMTSPSTFDFNTREHPLLTEFIRKRGACQFMLGRYGSPVIMCIESGVLVLRHEYEIHNAAQKKFELLYAFNQIWHDAKGLVTAEAEGKIREAYLECLQAIAVRICKIILMSVGGYVTTYTRRNMS